MLQHLSLRQLEYFIAIADSGSIALAATRLHVSQSAVATTLTTLETALGVQLCVRRRSRGITLTASGRLLRERAQGLVEDADAIVREVSGRTESGTVVLGCSVEQAPTMLPPIIAEVARTLPGIEIQLRIELEESFWSLLESGDVDLAITLDQRQPESLRSVPLRAMPVWAFLPPGHRLAAEEVIDLRDLADEDFVLLDTEPGATHAASMFTAVGRRPRIVHRTQSFELARSLVARGLGVTLQIQRPAADVSYEGLPLVVRPIDPPLRREYATIAWSARTRPSARAQAVIEAAKRAWPDPEASVPLAVLTLEHERRGAEAEGSVPRIA